MSAKEKIKRLLAVGWTPRTIAGELGMTDRIVYKWLRGEAKPRPQTMKRLRGLNGRKR